MSPSQPCPAGHYCLPGTKTADMNAFTRRFDIDAFWTVRQTNETGLHAPTLGRDVTWYPILPRGNYNGTAVTGKVTTTAWRQKLMPEPLVNPLWIRDKQSGVVVYDRTQRSWPFYDRELPRASIDEVVRTT